MTHKDPLILWSVYYGAGISLTLIVFLLPTQAKVFLGRFLPPNYASVLHVPLAWVGYLMYLDTHFLTACLLIGLSGSLDKFDGMSARAHDKLVGTAPGSESFWNQMSHRGTTALGKKLDPFSDKAASIPIYLHIAMVMLLVASRKDQDISITGLLYLAIGLIGLMIGADVFGQVIRMERFGHWHARDDQSATLVGKVKSALQWLWLGLYVIWHQGWLAEPEVFLLFLDFMLAVMMALAMVSASSKIKPLREI